MDFMQNVNEMFINYPGALHVTDAG